MLLIPTFIPGKQTGADRLAPCAGFICHNEEHLDRNAIHSGCQGAFRNVAIMQKSSEILEPINNSWS